MRLSIAKGEAKGLLGGTNFTISAKVKLTDEEFSLIKRFKLEKEPIVVGESKSILSGALKENPIVIGDFVNGVSFKCKSVNDIINWEINIRDSCQTLGNYFKTLKEFDGDIVVEF